jgi:hypothetical protein
MTKDIKVGTRVICSDYVGENNEIDCTGRVIAVSSWDIQVFCVEFDKFINGHNGFNTKIKGKDGHCWWVGEYHLTPLFSENVTEVEE